MKQLVTATLLLVAAWPAMTQAQDTDAADAEPVPVYDIEIIVFEYVNGVRGSREDWGYIDTGRDAAKLETDAQNVFSDRPLTDIDQNEDGESRMEDANRRRPFSFTRLDDTQFRLQDQFQRLRSSRDYRPISHGAWRQPVYGESEKTTLQLSSVARTPAAMGGEITLFVSRFLHLKLDLQLAADSADTNTLVYKLDEQRKMRSAELHFFDHPRFGAIALISKAESPVPLD
ncbi:MAG: CsiV family protein [Woeseiaceae bacterium]